MMKAMMTKRTKGLALQKQVVWHFQRAVCLHMTLECKLDVTVLPKYQKQIENSLSLLIFTFLSTNLHPDYSSLSLRNLAQCGCKWRAGPIVHVQCFKIRVMCDVEV